MRLNRRIYQTLLILAFTYGLGANILTAQPVNDLPCNAIELVLTETCEFSEYTNIDASDSGIPDPGCGNYLGGDIWFKIKVPASGAFSIQTDTETEFQFPLNNGWMYRAAMTVYSGNCNTLVQMACYENNGIYHPRMAGAYIMGQTPGDTLWVRIWENTNNDVGKLKICASFWEANRCPSVFTVSRAGGYCDGEMSPEIYLSGSELGFQYSLIRDDTIQMESLPGTGESLIWTDMTEHGWYKVRASHPFSTCVETMNDSAMVAEPEILQLSFQVSSITCFEKNDGSIITTISGGTEPYTSLWSGPGGFSSTEPMLYDLAPGSYSLKVTDVFQCADSAQDIMISQPDQLVATVEQVTNLTSYEANDGSILLSVVGGTPPYAFSWTSTDQYESVEQNAMGLTVGHYDVRVSDANDCQVSVLKTPVIIEFTSPEVFIPEGFSPNGDGYNDYFVIVGIEEYPDTELQILNAQGVTLYHSPDYRNEWDGRPVKGAVLGETLPEGTYYYVLKFAGGSAIKGFIYLNRE